MWARIFMCTVCAAALMAGGCEEDKKEETGVPVAQIQFSDPMLQQCIAGHRRAAAVAHITSTDRKGLSQDKRLVPSGRPRAGLACGGSRPGRRDWPRSRGPRG